MRKVDLASIFIWIMGAVFAVLGIGCIIFCIQNGGTILNWVGGIVMSIGGIGMLVVNTYFSIKKC